MPRYLATSTCFRLSDAGYVTCMDRNRILVSNTDNFAFIWVELHFPDSLPVAQFIKIFQENFGILFTLILYYTSSSTIPGVFEHRVRHCRKYEAAERNNNNNNNNLRLLQLQSNRAIIQYQHSPRRAETSAATQGSTMYYVRISKQPIVYY